jgi:transposase
VVDRAGVPLAALLSGANRHDSVLFEALIDAVPPTKTPAGRRRKRPAKLHADKGYDYPRCRRALSRRGIKVRIARRGVDSSERLGRHRWVVERTLAWLNRYRRLTVRYERRADIHRAFLSLGLRPHLLEPAPGGVLKGTLRARCRRRRRPTGRVPDRLDDLADRLDDQLRLVDLDVVAALGGDHQPRPRRRRDQLRVQPGDRPIDRVPGEPGGSRPGGRSDPGGRPWVTRTSGLPANGAAATAARTASPASATPMPSGP